MPEKLLSMIATAKAAADQHIESGVHYNRTFWTFLFLIVVGFAGRVLVAGEPFKAKEFIGELCLAVVGGFGLYALGMMQDMDEWQIILMGALGGWGGVRMIEWAVKIVTTISKMNKS